VALVFEHGEFTPYDTLWTTRALYFYLLGLIFAAIDWPLNYAFYARQNTLTPALVGVLSVAVYLAVALTLVGPMGMLGLVLADSAKHLSHAVTMLILTWRHTGSLADLRLGQTAIKAVLAGGVMAGLMAVTLNGLSRLVGSGGLAQNLVLVGVTGILGLAVYLGAVALLRVDEIAVLRDEARRRLR
jgi:putative peptidoglycan lipid II flippase